MKYMGSKNRIAKEILPIMLKERGQRTWVEPFVGGGNMISENNKSFRGVEQLLKDFYAFAMQCMSTLATTYRETKSWKYPAIQFLYMTTLAYLSAFIVYQLLA